MRTLEASIRRRIGDSPSRARMPLRSPPAGHPPRGTNGQNQRPPRYAHGAAQRFALQRFGRLCRTQVQYTISATEEHINENTKPKAKSAASACWASSWTTINRIEEKGKRYLSHSTSIYNYLWQPYPYSNKIRSSILIYSPHSNFRWLQIHISHHRIMGGAKYYFLYLIPCSARTNYQLLMCPIQVTGA